MFYHLALALLGTKAWSKIPLFSATDYTDCTDLSRPAFKVIGRLVGGDYSLFSPGVFC
jgi:hypothetical protein